MVFELSGDLLSNVFGGSEGEFHRPCAFKCFCASNNDIISYSCGTTSSRDLHHPQCKDLCSIGSTALTVMFCDEDRRIVSLAEKKS
jgi:hypothetical protein